MGEHEGDAEDGNEKHGRGRRWVGMVVKATVKKKEEYSRKRVGKGVGTPPG